MKTSILATLLVGVSAAAFSTSAEAGKKLTYGDFTLTGGITLGLSTDRNAGVAPAGERSAADDFDDEDEDEDSDDGDDFEADAFEDLDLEGDDLADQLDETTDEDGDGDFFDDDGEAVDLDGDGIPDEDLDGDGIEDPVEADAGDAIPDDADAIALDGSTFAATAGTGPTNIRDERFTTKAKLGLSYKIGSWAKEWKTAAQMGTTHFDTLDKKDNMLFGMNTGPVFKVKNWNATIQPTLLFASLTTDGNHQFDNYGAGIAATFDLTKTWQLGVRYGYDVRDFENPLVENVNANSFGTALKYKLSKTQAITGGYRARFEDTNPDPRGKEAHQFSLGYQQKWDNGIYVKPTVGYAFIERNGATRATLPVREDKRTTFNVALGKTFDHGINVEAQYGNMDTDVNLPRKDSANDRLVLLTGWKF